MAIKPAEPQAVVIFGASGDLTRRKLLPAFYHLFVEGLLPEGFAIVGYARTEQTDDEFHERARQAIQQFGRTDSVGEEWEEFKKLDLDRARRALTHPIMFDGRNLFDPAEMERLGFIYKSIGR